jgi:hypothetical protein
MATQTAATESVLAALNGDSIRSMAGSLDGSTNIPNESRVADPPGAAGVAAAGAAVAAFDVVAAPGDSCGRTPVDREKTLIAITPNDEAAMSTIPPAFADTFLLTRAHH